MMRRRVIDLALAYHARARVVYVEAPFADIVSRNRARSAAVPETILYRLLDKLEMPYIGEAHQVEWVQKA
jgi:predicted kinase